MERTSLKYDMDKNQRWLIFAGLILIASGIGLFANFCITKSWVNIFIAVMYLIASSVYIMHAFRFWQDQHLGFILHMSAGVLYFLLSALFFVSTQFFVYPYFQYFLYLICLSFACSGIFRIYTAILQDVKKGWLWTLYAGVINLLMIAMILCGIATVPFISMMVSSASDMVATGGALLALAIANHFAKK